MRGRYCLMLALLTTAISTGCGGGGGTRQDVPAGQLAVSPSSLNFGKVPVGQKSTQTGTLKAGNSGITVASADWSGEGFSVSGIAFPVTVPAGQSVSFKVTFAPQKAGSSSGNITLPQQRYRTRPTRRRFGRQRNPVVRTQRHAFMERQQGQRGWLQHIPRGVSSRNVTPR